MLCGDDTMAAQDTNLVNAAEARILFVRCGGALDDDHGILDRAEFNRLVAQDQLRRERRTHVRAAAAAAPTAAALGDDELLRDPALEA